MDPLTQGTLGAVLPQAVAKRGKAGQVMLCGVSAGMAPDLDVLIRSSSDPLLFLEYHRQFTHSLPFIPLGAALVGIFLWTLWGRRRGWTASSTYLYCFLGYATHALLDACTTYGTLLWWPFSDQRFAWNSVSIIDPLFTVPLLLAVTLARWKDWRWPARLGLCWAIAYLTLGLLGRDAAQDAGWQLAAQRGHQPELIDAKPSFANIFLWKTIYRAGDRYYVDAVRLGANTRIYPGESIDALNLERDLPWLDPASLQARDIERFRWFSMGYLALNPEQPNQIMDLRYSLLPNDIAPLWSIELSPADQYARHVRYVTARDTSSATLERFVRMLRGQALLADAPSGQNRSNSARPP
ncbi:MAG: metal-dependent hydrolase [Congregibacter sp.]